ncbi:hypothetical protein GCM10027517_38710 [Phycicoccus ginsengisoli]
MPSAFASTSKAGDAPPVANRQRVATGVSAATEAGGAELLDAADGAAVEAAAREEPERAAGLGAAVVPPEAEVAAPEPPVPPDPPVLVGRGAAGTLGRGAGSVGNAPVSGWVTEASGWVTGASGSVLPAAWLGPATAASVPPVTRSAAQPRRTLVRWSRIGGARFRRRT